jgi:hypothetical protein
MASDTKMRENRYRPLLATEWELGEQIEHEEEWPVVRPPLVKLPPGPWRSLGGYLDYTDWPERERFAELDLAIKSRADALLPSRVDTGIRTPRRCRAVIPEMGNCNAIVTLGENYDGWKCEAHRKPARGAHRAVSTAAFQAPRDRGSGRVANGESGALENFRLALLSYRKLPAQGGA